MSSGSQSEQGPAATSGSRWGAIPLLERLPVFSWITGVRGECEYLNTAWRDFTGQVAASDEWIEAVHPGDRAAARDVFTTAVEEQSACEFECRVRRAGGEYHTFLVQAWPRLDGGRFAGHVSVCLDITRWRQVEEDLRQSQEHLRLTIEQSPLGLITAYPDGRIRSANASLCRLLGRTEAEMLAMPLHAITHPDDRAVTQHYIEALARGEVESCEFEKRYLHKDGSVIQAVLRGRMARDVSGAPLFVIGMVEDITGRRRAEQALQFSEARLQRAQRVANLGTWEQDLTSGRDHTECSEEARRIVGLEDRGGPVTPDLFFARVHPEDRNLVFARFLETVATGTPCAFDHRIVRPGGEIRYVRMHGEITTGEDGERRLVGTVQDITSYKQVEEQLLQSQKMDAVGRLAGGLAHDLNNLLTIINGNRFLLAQETSVGDPKRELLDEIGSACDRAADLTRQLLAFSRKQVVQLGELDLNSVVAETERMLRRLIGEDVELVLHLDPRAGRVRADLAQLQQVLMNLATNARDAMPGGGRLTIETRGVETEVVPRATPLEAPPKRMVALVVSDNGCGMDPATRARVLEPFFTTKPKGQGTGLGLSTVYGIVRQSGGEMAIWSEPGVGTRCTIYLPRLPDGPAAPGEGEGSTGVTVLLVEAEPAVRVLESRFLRDSGFRVLEASSGEQALQICASYTRAIHLVITDLKMPGMTGRELARRLAPARPDLRFLYVSGFTAEDAEIRSALDPGADFLHKPFSPETLIQKVRDALAPA